MAEDEIKTPKQTSDDVRRDRREAAIRVYIEASKAISDNVRLVGIGFLALYFAFLSNESLNSIGKSYPIIMFAIGACGILIIITDYLQQIFRYINALSVSSSKDRLFKHTDLTYRITKYLFIIKQCIAAFGGICLIYIFATVSGVFKCI